MRVGDIKIAGMSMTLRTFTTSARDAAFVDHAATGTIIFNTTVNAVQVYNGSLWVDIDQNLVKSVDGVTPDTLYGLLTTTTSGMQFGADNTSVSIDYTPPGGGASVQSSSVLTTASPTLTLPPPVAGGVWSCFCATNATAKVVSHAGLQIRTTGAAQAELHFSLYVGRTFCSDGSYWYTT